MKLLSSCWLTPFALIIAYESLRDLAANLITHYVGPIGFIVAVLIIALTIWLIRSLVESNPEPFFLNLTFFAFAGQCIRVGELITEGNLSRFQTFLFLVGLFFVVSQVFVMKAHMRTTREHYRQLLTLHRNDNSSPTEVDHWANALLQISGVDFYPQSYRRLEWLHVVFATEPREKSRRDAFAILPNNLFRVTPPSNFTAESLIVPQAQRTRLWNCYVIICVISWAVFVVALLFSVKYP